MDSVVLPRSLGLNFILNQKMDTKMMHNNGKLSLSSAISESLKMGEVSRSFESNLLLDNKKKVRHKDETEYWDYKEDIDLNNPVELAKLAKRVLGFYNSKGGVLIYGVNDDYFVTGIHKNKVCDTVRVNSKLKKYIGNDIGLFQSQISTNYTNKVIWLLFIPKRKGMPISVLSNGPEYKGSLVIRKNQYYIRIHDEVKLCVDPGDFERLFSGASFKHLHAYLYEVDETYYRLLTPHCDRFVGRKAIIEQIQTALKSRSYIIALDGLGGVGKSAVAIELLRKLYKSNQYQFIISISAKNKIWHGQTESRQAGFSGFSQLIKEVAKVLDVDMSGKDPETIKHEVIMLMEGVEGLLLIDNIEDVEDSAVFKFLKDEVPEPVKILVTSRISRDLGARSIFIPEMNDEEAKELFYHELERVGYYGYLSEGEQVSQILSATGRLPLALKWAASMAANANSLKSVSTRLRSFDTTKREFLDFCFSTMFDGLSSIARDVALLCSYLGDEWEPLLLSIALGQPVKSVDRAIDELENKGILQSSIPSRKGSFSVLPLTMDFLSNKWHQNKKFREEVLERICKSAVSSTHRGHLLDWPIKERVKVLFENALKLEKKDDFEEALKNVKLALQWSIDNQIMNDDTEKMRFLEGKIIYKFKDKREGITRMQIVLENISKNLSYSDENIFYAQAVLSHGRSNEEMDALKRIVSYIQSSSIVTQPLIEEFFSRTIRLGDFKLLSDLMNNAKDNSYSYWILKASLGYLSNKQFLFTIGKPVLKIVKRASGYEGIDEIEKEEFNKKANEIKILFEQNPGYVK